MRHQYKKMERSLCIGLLVLLAAPAHSEESSRWSRQISSYTSDISDWVPLTKPIERISAPDQPIKRQAIAQPRILTEPFSGFNRPTGFSQDNFQSGTFYNQQNKPLYLQSVPSAPQNYLTDQGFGQQSIRLALGSPQFPLSQGFVAPSYSFDNVQKPDLNRFPQLQQSALPNPVKFESFQKKLPPTLPPPAKPGFNTIPAPKRQESPKFMDGYRLENVSQDFNNAKRRPQSLQKLKFEAPQLPQRFENFNQRNEKVSEIYPTRQTRPTTNVEREEVQLLYVPVEQLNGGQFSYKNVPNAAVLNRDLYSSPAVQRPDTINHGFLSNIPKPQGQRPPQQSFQTIPQDYLNSLNAQKFNQNSFNSRNPQFATSSAPLSPFPTSVTTPKPKKLKPHQPPLAVFMAQESKKSNSIKVADVLSTLKSAKNIAVLDSVSPSHSPKVFIGPSSLSPPENYVKFELPYLSNLENTDRKLRQLPFFVAPLSYNTPDGFAKIPFPSPHVGSVIVNSLLKESNNNPFATSTPFADVIPNSYTAGTTSFSGERQTPFTNSVTTKPTFSYFSTVPPKAQSTPDLFQSQYFSFEPQNVAPIKPSREPEPNIITAPPANVPSLLNTNFPSNIPQQQYVKFPSQNNEAHHSRRPDHSYQSTGQTVTASNIRSEHFNNKLKLDLPSSQAPPPTTPPPPSTTRVTSPKAPSTFASNLLETHNPFSINQAFEFSSPLDYHNVYEENKNELITPSITQTPKLPSKEEVVTEKEILRPSSPNYLQNYSPEIHYQSEILSSRFPSFDVNSYPSSTEASTENYTPSRPSQLDLSSEKNNDEITPVSNPEYVQTTRSPYLYEEYTSNRVSGQEITKDNTAESSSTTTSTTTRRPLRSRGRPRYTTPKPDSGDSTTKAAVTRRPLRERRPLPSRNRIETGKSTTENPTKLQPETTSSTTESSVYKSTRLRTRGRNHYKPTEHPDEIYEVTKTSKSKPKEENDIAYQRDVLHQNYPVTIIERMSTVDIEAITSPSPRISSTRFISREPSTESYSQESYVTEQPSRYSNFEKSPLKEVEPPTFTSRTATVQTEAPYVPRFSATINEEPSYHSRSSTKQYEEPTFEARPSSFRYEQSSYTPRLTTTHIKSETSEASTTESIRSSSYSAEYETYSEEKVNTPIRSEEETTIIPSNSYEISKVDDRVQLTENNNLNEEPVQSEEQEVYTVPSTTGNYRTKLRNRQFSSRQSVSSTTESGTTVSQKTTRTEIKRRPIQPITYRPAFDRRRTTMRIEEIEAGLKTKQIHAHPEELPENRHPVYKPEPTTEYVPTTQAIKKISQYRRRRPVATLSVSTTTETLASTKKPTYETRNRFRGRRPTTEKQKEVTPQEETASFTTQKSLPNNRYNHRIRIPDRYNRKPATTASPEESNEENEQDADYSIHRPKIVPFEEKSGEEGTWSPNASSQSFKPYNPNDIQERSKITEDYGIKVNDSHYEEPDIITVRNDYDDILISVTPASNRLNKKIPDIPPTLEAFVEQSKSITTGGESDTISTIESVIEEMMKSLEEKDEDEYTRNVMKHEGGEIGEIPPEKVISSIENTSENNKQRQGTEQSSDGTTSQETSNSDQETVKDRKARRRGVWKKVRVRPATTESFEVAESQFYINTVNHLGSEVKPSRQVENKFSQESAPFANPTTPTEIKEQELEPTTIFPEIPDALEISDAAEISDTKNNYTDVKEEEEVTTPPPFEAELLRDIIKYESEANKEIFKTEKPSTADPANPGDMDLGTGSPDPTVMDIIYTPTTEATSSDLGGLSILENSKDINGVMDYLFGFTSTDESKHENTDNSATTQLDTNMNATEKIVEISTEKSVATEVSKSKATTTTTETSFIPQEITDSTTHDDDEIEGLITDQFEIKKINTQNVQEPIEEPATTEPQKQEETIEQKETIETSSASSFMDPAMVISTSMSTEVSHETEICFRGRCIKTSNELV